MIRINEVCCGCNPHTATLLLLWLTIVFCAVSIVNDAYNFTETTPKLPESEIISFFNKNLFVFIYKLSVLIISVAGLYGIIKDKPKFLMIFYYYNCFQIFIIFGFIVYMLIDPSTGEYLQTESGSSIARELYGSKIFLAVALVFGLVLQGYFFVIVKNEYEIMLENYELMNESRIIVTRYSDLYYYNRL